LKNKEEIITTTCCYDCGARCLLKVHVNDGKILRISTERVKDLNIVACPKGLMQKEVACHKDRIMQPMLRAGRRGQGKFKKISWDKAIDLIAEQIQATVKKHGSESVYFLVNTGSLSTLHNSRNVTNRFFGLLGRCTTAWCNVSFEGALQSSLATFGTPYTGCTRDNLFHSKLMILWGWNPLISRFGSDTEVILAKIKKSGVKVIGVDPRKNKSCQILAEQWIKIRPGSDAAMLISMAHVMIKEDLYDKDFIAKYTTGFGKFYDYVTGKDDGVKKTPDWAQSICGVPEESIIKLARQYALTKPAALITGFAPGRSIFGEQFHRAASVLAAMTGNIGIKGGFVSGGVDFIGLGLFKDKIPVPETEHNLLHKADFYDAILNGKSKKYPADCKILYIVGCNMLNQYLNLNKGIKALSKPDLIILHELFLTPTSNYTDIILPITHFFENSDIGHLWLGGPYLISMNKVLESLPDGPKSDLQIFGMLAKKNWNNPL
jgi:anaerobic dimethyl sulfoxide reductase subunit A